MNDELVIDAFAGPGGWDVGARLAGFTGRILGIEWSMDACRTGLAAGHWRVCADVAAFPLAHLAGRVTGVILSPPCPSFSTAGEGAGKIDLPNVLRLIADYAAGREPGAYEWADERSALSAQPMRYAVALRPRWIALEQVPPVLPIWQYIADRLRGLGYRVWTGILSAEEYGVPQTRKRAVLTASLDGPVLPPAPTHQAYVSGRDPQVDDDLFGSPLPPPVSMAQALGWGESARVVSNYGTGGDAQARGERTGAEPAATVTSKVDRNTVYLAPAGAASQMVDPRPAATDPAHTITGKATAAWVLRNNSNANACVRELHEPAGTMFFGKRGNAVDWVVSTGNNSRQGGGATAPYERDGAAPAPTLTGNVSRWQGRPATTVCGDARIAPPGHRDREGGERQFGEDTVRVSVQEAGILQSFPPDYPWQGTKTQQYLQVGNAIPPLLAAAILRPLLGASAEGEVAA